ncbi:hypothetical protein BRARA_D01228 [Brassica rapa]|uniref:HSF-type DNA-binding domain-containing protein n=2 Tax=Brassica campestris TaxID=3711 RepID=A0A397ZK99_BRACM|nr:heat stress transcription factor A-8-like [Brassica napus]RID66062.1 hypothetical protein BRARA_D01228 [Brassica rapa]CAG7906796.1 unnamed protein product [Brassica rapa]
MEIEEDRKRKHHSLDAIISWTNNSNNSFIVWDVARFCTKILPKSVEFGRNFSEFVSELRHHGFQRIGWFEFGHINFVRSRPWPLKRMVPSKAWDEKLKAKRDKAKAKKARAKVVRLLENLQI